MFIKTSLLQINPWERPYFFLKPSLTIIYTLPRQFGMLLCSLYAVVFGIFFYFYIFLLFLYLAHANIVYIQLLFIARSVATATVGQC